jgi:hypothetical protein
MSDFIDELLNKLENGFEVKDNNAWEKKTPKAENEEDRLTKRLIRYFSDNDRKRNFNFWNRKGFDVKKAEDVEFLSMSVKQQIQDEIDRVASIGF